jgi:superfamily II DNA or RNA helicase
MDGLKLRDYQEKYIIEIQKSFGKGNKKIILCAPTGAGKTIMFSFMTKGAFDKDKKILIITDRKELFSQSTGSISKMGLKANEIKPNCKIDLNHNLHVAMVQTIMRRLNKEDYISFLNNLDLIIIDEAHKTIFDNLFEYLNVNTFVIGATATPHREGKQLSLKTFYTDIVQVIDTPELIKKGNLSTPESYGVPINLKGIKTKGGDFDEKSMADKFSEIKLFHGVYDNYQRLTANKKALVFAPNVEASKELVESFSDKGLPCKHVDCYMTDEVRKDTLKWFEQTKGAILSNYGILTTGFDCPSIEVVILYRATKSLPLFLQMVGRGSRVTESKNTFSILDFGNNIKTHNYWEENRIWSLDKKEKKEGETPIKECPECFYLLHSRIMECPSCGYLFEKSEKEKEDLIIIELQKMNKRQLIEAISIASFKDLEIIQKAKGYAKNWIFHQLKTKEDFYEYEKFMGYKKGWAYNQLKMKGL